MHSITGRPERMPRMMVSMRVGQLLHEAVGAACRRAASRSGRRANMPTKSAGQHADADRHARCTKAPSQREHRADAERDRRRRSPTDQLEPGAAEVGAQPRGVEQRHERAPARRSASTMAFGLLLLAHQHQPRVVDVEPAGHPPAADAGQALAVLVLHPQHHGEHEQARARSRPQTEATKIAPATIRSTDIPSPPAAGCRGRSTRRAA